MLTLNDGRSELWQWDTGRKLTVDADCSQVHFSNKVFGRSIDVDVVDGVAVIPDILLQTDKDLNVWAFVGTPENGYTKINKVFKVNKRNKPADYVFTPPEQTTLEEIKEKLDYLESIQDPDAIKNAVDEYLANNPIQIDEKDPTVPDWAKQTTKPKYTATEVGAVAKVNGVKPDANGNVEITIQDSGGNVEKHNIDPTAHADIRNHLTAANIVEAASGEPIVLDDASDMDLVGLKVYGKTIQNGTPTPEIPVPLVNVGNGGSITVKVRTSETDENPQTQTISTPNGLPGIPVSSGGNYTDENGQQWICDEVDFAKGTYTQRILRYTFTGTEPFQRSTYSHWIPLSDLGLSLANIKAALCNWYTFSLASINNAQTPGAFDFYYPAPDFITPKQFRASTYGFDTVSDFKTALRNAYDAGNPMYCLFVLSEPVEMNLTESELPTNVSLHTNYPNTAISNDCGAGMEVEYVADTKLYIDKKFAELSQALLNQ